MQCLLFPFIIPGSSPTLERIYTHSQASSSPSSRLSIRSKLHHTSNKSSKSHQNHSGDQNEARLMKLIRLNHHLQQRSGEACENQKQTGDATGRINSSTPDCQDAMPHQTDGITWDGRNNRDAPTTQPQATMKRTCSGEVEIVESGGFGFGSSQIRRRR
ncbi:uncharacterized protein BCR38DRAFT_438031 [Pseudomassariella vexata]|uniref:Uncharacterized protein n=1 Tax=Pseudomassariella vexata TaxID=1141098 RepID=A0A1Y2DT27_9PEZI|nr:uncharacterized protein BCR38DRAFT_438031 [Pseudomassariella vexata]ORY62296.1 hypothetical protein BCR38DRAFT_438031 [Pseudomassariella vexata]